MIGIGVGINRRQFTSAGAPVGPVATAATGIGDTSFTANWNAFAGAQYYLLDVSTSPSFSSYVGLYENYVTVGTSLVVSGLSSSTTFYYRLRAVTDVDTDAASFVGRVYSAGGVLSYTEVTATEALVVKMKFDGIWNSMKAIYPMVGASAAACAQNLKSSSFTGVFNGSWTFSSQGGSTVKSSGAYMDTRLIASIELNSSSSHNSYYNNLAVSGDSNVVIGDGVIDSLFTGLYQVSNLFYSANACNFEGAVLDTNTAFFLSNKQSANTLKHIKNSAIIKTSTVVNKGFTSLQNLFLNNYNTSATFSTGSRCAFASFGDGLTDTQAGLFYTAVQAFQTTLSREV